MNISRPPLPLPSHPHRLNNHLQPPVLPSTNPRKTSKNGVSLVRDHSIRFDKQYQQKHLIIKSGIRLESLKKTASSKELEETTMGDRSTFVGSAKTLNALDQTIGGMGNSSKHGGNNNFVTNFKPVLGNDVMSMTSLDMNYPRQQSVERNVTITGKK